MVFSVIIMWLFATSHRVMSCYLLLLGNDDSFDQSTDRSVSSSTFWGWIGISGTLIEGYEKVGWYWLVIRGSAPVVVKGN